MSGGNTNAGDRSAAEVCADELVLWMEDLARLDARLRERVVTSPVVPRQRGGGLGRTLRKLRG